MSSSCLAKTVLIFNKVECKLDRKKGGKERRPGVGERRVDNEQPVPMKGTDKSTVICMYGVDKTVN